MDDSAALLVGDVGATNTRLTLVRSAAGSPSVLREAVFPSRDYAGLEEPVRKFLQEAPAPARRAVFAVAGPVVEGRAELTNLGWVLEEEGLRESLDLTSVRLLNDLVAMAYAIPHLGPESLLTLQAGRPVPGGARAVVAPGTGLGHAFLTWDGTTYRAHPSEGGHADFAPVGRLQDELLHHLRTRYGHVSCERACSGRALPDLYAFLEGHGTAPEREGVAERLATAPDRTPVIVEEALRTPHSPRCLATIELFAAILAAEAGNVALRALATGGVYLGGGLPRRLLPVLTRAAFLDPFRHKGRLSPFLSRIPLYVVIRPNVGLLGALQCAFAGHAG